MSTMASQITSLTIVYSSVYSDADQRKHQSSASLAFVRRIHRRPVNSPHKWPVTRKMFPFVDVIMQVGRWNLEKSRGNSYVKRDHPPWPLCVINVLIDAPTDQPVEKTYLAHYDDVIMTMLASQITSLTVVYSIVYSGVNQRKHQSPASLAFVREIHRGPVNFPHKWPVTRKMFPFDDVIMR